MYLHLLWIGEPIYVLLLFLIYAIPLWLALSCPWNIYEPLMLSVWWINPWLSFKIFYEDLCFQDSEGLRETGKFYGVSPVCIEGVAHDMMLDCSWEKGAEVILSWLNGLNKQHLIWPWCVKYRFGHWLLRQVTHVKERPWQDLKASVLFYFILPERIFGSLRHCMLISLQKWEQIVSWLSQIKHYHCQMSAPKHTFLVNFFE